MINYEIWININEQMFRIGRKKKIGSPGETRNSSWPYRQHTCTIKVNNLLFCSDNNDVLQFGPIFNVFSSIGNVQFTLLHVVHLYVLTIEEKNIYFWHNMDWVD